MDDEPESKLGTALRLLLVSPLIAVLLVGLEFVLVRIGVFLGLILVAGPRLMTAGCLLAGLCWGFAFAAVDTWRKLATLAGAIAFAVLAFQLIGLFDWLGLSELNATAPLMGAMVGVGMAGPVTCSLRRLLIGAGLGGVLGLAAAWWYVPEVWALDDVGWVAGRVGMILLHAVFGVGVLLSLTRDHATEQQVKA